MAREATRQRMERHERPHAVAQALREIPRSIAWKGLDALSALDVPCSSWAPRTTRTRSTRSAWPRSTAASCPNAELVVEDKGDSPLAWQGARLSNVIADFLERVGYSPKQH